MAPLPAQRVTPARLFSFTGLDYAGPFAVRTSKGRGQRGHIYIYGDKSRTYRGSFRLHNCHLPTRLPTVCLPTWSLPYDLQRQWYDVSRCSCRAAPPVPANFRVLPGGGSGRGSERRDVDVHPSSRPPHCGGLWEAAVKAFKHHLRRVVGEAKLTFEEFSTFCTQVEACLNSRPLSPLSSDPQDLTALTSGHFLVGTSLTAPPEPFGDESVTGLPRWKLTVQMRNHFWRRWRREALHHALQQSKWFVTNHAPQVGDSVLLTDDQQPPLKWPLARILALHPGPDGLARVTSLKTASTTLRRPLVRLIALPADEATAAHFAALSFHDPSSSRGLQFCTRRAHEDLNIVK